MFQVEPEKSQLLAERLGDLLIELAQFTNCENFSRLSEFHGIRRFFQNFPKLSKEFAPEDRESNNNLAQTAFALKCAGLQQRIGTEFNKRGIRFLSFKGISLSQLLYGDIAARAFGDLDLLIAPNSVLETFDLLEKSGLIRTKPANFSIGQELALVRYGKAQNFYCRQSSLSLDLHWKLLSSWIGADILTFTDLWERSQVIQRAGLTPWRTLGTEDTIVFLALHGFQDGWSRLKQLLDMAMALEASRHDWDEVLRRAGPRAVLVQMAAELVWRLLGVGHVEREHRFYQSDRQALQDWLRMATHSHTPQRRLLRRHLWSCSTGEALVRSFAGLFTPAVDDIQSVSLPPKLISLYPLVRASRLLMKATTRSYGWLSD